MPREKFQMKNNERRKLLYNWQAEEEEWEKNDLKKTLRCVARRREVDNGETI